MAFAVVGILFSAVESLWTINEDPPRWSPVFPNWDCRNTEYDEFRESQQKTFHSWLEQEIDPYKCPLGWIYQKLLQKEWDIGEPPSLFILLGTDWPIIEILAYYSVEDNLHGDEALKADLNCWNVTDPIDFSKFREVLWSGGWFIKGIPFALHPSMKTQSDWIRTYYKCPYGAIAQKLWNIYISSQANANSLEQNIAFFEVGAIKEFGLKDLTLGHNWPLMPLLHKIKMMSRRHGFWMDFSPIELTGADISGSDGAIEEGSIAFGGTYAHAARVVSAGKVFTFLHKGKARNLVYLTMVFGDYNKYLEKYMRRAEALGIYYLVIYCLDDEALAICKSVDKNRCVHGGKRSTLNKYALPLVFLSMGVDVFYVDADTFWMKNPTPYLIQRLKETNTEMLVSASFADDCICAGIIYWGATKAVREWTFLLLSWMYEHFHIDDQQIISAFLQHGDVENLTRAELLSRDHDFQMHLLPMLPKTRWAILDPVVQFAHARSLNTTGWTGDLEDMVIFHFLRGNNEFNAESAAANWTAKYGYATETNHSLEDIFYGEPLEFYTNPNATLTNQMKAAAYRSWRPERPTEMLHCGNLIDFVEVSENLSPDR